MNTKKMTTAEFFGSIPMIDGSCWRVSVNVGRGKSVEGHEFKDVRNDPSEFRKLMTLLPDFAKRGRVLDSLDWGISYGYDHGSCCTAISINILKRQRPTATNITADFIEGLSRVLGYGKIER